jgi:hypothetical protein
MASERKYDATNIAIRFSRAATKQTTLDGHPVLQCVEGYRLNQTSATRG